MRAEVLVIVASCQLFLPYVLVPAGHKIQFKADPTECGWNLMEIGRAMLDYANDYEGRLPATDGCATH